MKIYFDDTYIDNNLIMALSRSSKLFENTFSLGATLCNTFELQVSKTIEYSPTRVYIKDDEDNVLFNLYVDNLDTENDNYYSYSLVDGMIKFNQYYDWTNITNPTVQTVLNSMCMYYLGTLAPTIEYIGDLYFPYTDGVTSRELVSYIAEINGGYAYIDSTNTLQFVKHKQAPKHTVDVNTCADIKVGTHFRFDRVALNNGVDTSYYPISATGDGDTLYINPDNILITDTGNYTRDGIIQHIYEQVNGLDFYNFTTSRCQIDDTVKPGDFIGFSFPDYDSLADIEGNVLLTSELQQLLVSQASTSDSVVIYTIGQFDWNYNINWTGGYELNVTSSEQEETQIVTEKDRIRRLSIKVDKENGEILQQISDLDGNMTKLIQDASSLTGYFESLNSSKYIRLSSDGIQVSKDLESGSVNITDVGVYIKNDDGIKVAEMKENEFDTTNWIYSETRNGNCLNIYRRKV